MLKWLYGAAKAAFRNYIFDFPQFYIHPCITNHELEILVHSVFTSKEAISLSIHGANPNKCLIHHFQHQLRVFPCLYILPFLWERSITRRAWMFYDFYNLIQSDASTTPSAPGSMDIFCWFRLTLSFRLRFSVNVDFFLSVIVLSDLSFSLFSVVSWLWYVEETFSSKLLFAVGRSLLVSIWATCELKCNCSPFSSLSWLFLSFSLKKWVLSSFTMLPYFQYIWTWEHIRGGRRVGGFG